MNLWQSTIDFRSDEGTVLVGGRTLRNGRNIDMTKHTGVIYHHILAKVHNLEINISLDDKKAMCLFGKSIGANKISKNLETLVPVIDAIFNDNRDITADVPTMLSNVCSWAVNIQNAGGLALWEIKKTLEPLLTSDSFVNMVSKKNAKVVLRGKYPKDYRSTVFSSLARVNATRVEIDDAPGSDDELAPWEDPAYIEYDLDEELEVLLEMYSQIYPSEMQPVLAQRHMDAIDGGAGGGFVDYPWEDGYDELLAERNERERNARGYDSAESSDQDSDKEDDDEAGEASGVESEGENGDEESQTREEDEEGAIGSL